MKIKETELKVTMPSGKIKIIAQYMLSPEPDHILRNKLTGLIIRTFIIVSSKAEIANYEEIED